ncbi:SH3 domain-containing protein [Flavilitoribacter nigricans]|uniref:SH3b domain-containing protein n=1 Tax=Flavilitoribacter nigricans (strain ATCC 23147 / DSM 23189 / NBRC 102662 / NCIMB 1420 / SS-2) TaxID=1122177 RepID=A0A2D0NHC6_FLAN2|nr:SH3 domain-containing protein [Flavilitoribacter nigricans]PHN07173.1 hypothetical protein CRP01_08080 [Flavilitoribacter nigricans DSM 23189 = NBRC 102662]
MAKESSLLPKMEVLIIIIFFIGIVIWAFDKCGDTKRSYSEQANSDTDVVEDLINRNVDAVELPPEDSLGDLLPPAATPSPARPASPAGTGYAPLYVTIDGLNLRDEPKLSGKVLTSLKLFEEVAFMGEVTDSTEQINLGRITPDEPWIKVRGRGHVGWVYGAGVEYYKKKLEGAY